MVETALLVPVLLLLVMASDDFGRVFYYAIAVTNAAREGARQAAYYDPTNSGSPNPSDNASGVWNAVTAELPNGITPVEIGPGNALDCPTAAQIPGDYPSGAGSDNTARVFICFNSSSLNTTAPQGGQVTVTILYNFTPVTPMASMVGISPVHVEASTTMIVQGAS
jgi:Flp pilus assembly protein TadG